MNNPDLFRLSKSKKVVDICANTLRDYNKRGLKFYRCGKAVFISMAELHQFITTGGPNMPYIEKSQLTEPGFIYFIQAGDTNMVKIGFTQTLDMRSKGLQTGCPYRLKPILIINGTMQDEKKMHARFVKSRKNGEWFEVEGELETFLANQPKQISGRSLIL
jgi:hypothetical protein